jgi:hypothetical protein
MATRRAIKGVLGNFLGTYVSRYSDCEGYLLFGFLVADLVELKINLLGEAISDPKSPIGVAVMSAATKFEGQRRKAGLSPSQVREAWLTILRMPGSKDGSINGHSCPRFNVRFSATALMDNGKRYQRESVVFIAPHTPEVELRSSRVG